MNEHHDLTNAATTLKVIPDLPLNAISWESNFRSSINPEHVATLQASIAMYGQLEAIRVAPAAGGYRGIDGKHRCMVLGNLGHATARAVVDNRTLTDAENIEIQYAINCVRSEVSLFDRAMNAAKLLTLMKRPQSAVAQRLNLTDGTLTKLLAIPTLPEAILANISQGQIGLNAAYALSKVSDPKKQMDLAQAVAEGRLTRDGIVREVNRTKRPVTAPINSVLKRAAVWLGKGRSITVAGESLDFETFIASCKSAMDKAKQARAQALTFQTFLKVARDQAKS